MASLFSLKKQRACRVRGEATGCHMSDSAKSKMSAQVLVAKAAEKVRLTKALKANLARRKAQTRARAEEGSAKTSGDGQE